MEWAVARRVRRGRAILFGQFLDGQASDGESGARGRGEGLAEGEDLFGEGEGRCPLAVQRTCGDGRDRQLKSESVDELSLGLLTTLERAGGDRGRCVLTIVRGGRRRRLRAVVMSGDGALTRGATGHGMRSEDGHGERRVEKYGREEAKACVRHPARIRWAVLHVTFITSVHRQKSDLSSVRARRQSYNRPLR
jgi:hypothetical protein